MSTSVLVAFATRYGSTQEVAEAVATTLRERGLDVDVQPVGKVRTLEGYSAVVLGTAIYFGAWRKDTDRFLVRYREVLAKLLVAIFALGPVGAPSDDEWRASRSQLDTQLAKHPWLAPVAVEMFGGKYDPASLRLPDSLIARLPASPLKQMPPSDLRDRTAIRAWADDLATKLESALPQ